MPHKSNLSQTATTGNEGTPLKDKEREGINIGDLCFPRTMVQRLVEGVIPANTRLQKDVVTAMSRSATLFVNCLAHACVNPSSHSPNPYPKKGPRSTAHTTYCAFSAQPINKNRANASPAMGTRKTIPPEAVLDALAELGFDNFLPRVQAELRRFNEVQTGKRNGYRRKLKEKEENGTMGTARGVKATENGLGDHDRDDGDEKAAKIVRWDDDELVTDAPSIPRKKVDIVEKVDYIEEEEVQEEEEVEGAMEIEDQSEDKDEESHAPADENGKNEATEEDENIYDPRKVFPADNNSEDEADEGDNDHDTSVADLDINEEEDVDSSEDSE